MAYFAPYIDETGMHIPSYEDIRDDLINSMKQIFGQDIYIDEDTMDYQQISIFAKKIYDTNALALLAYNNRTPNTSIGVGLDNLCSFVGISRKPATYSVVNLTITGTPSAIIENGQASDGTYIWDLPEQVIIPDSGVIIVEAKCHVAGNIQAAPDSITQIVTPTFGWTGVTNNSSATSGSDIETDADLRGRYAESAYSPSSTVFDGIDAAIRTVSGVKRVKGYENDTNVAIQDPDLDPHSIMFVVEGGADNEVAEQILYKKTPGCGTVGETAVDLFTAMGNTTTIKFQRPAAVTIKVEISITTLSGYNTAFADEIKNRIVDYINGLDIGENLYTNMLIAIASSVNLSSSPSFVVTSLKTGGNGVTPTVNDIAGHADSIFTIGLNDVTLTVS